MQARKQAKPCVKIKFHNDRLDARPAGRAGCLMRWCLTKKSVKDRGSYTQRTCLLAWLNHACGLASWHVEFSLCHGLPRKHSSMAGTCPAQDVQDKSNSWARREGVRCLSLELAHFSRRHLVELQILQEFKTTAAQSKCHCYSSQRSNTVK